MAHIITYSGVRTPVKKYNEMIHENRLYKLNTDSTVGHGHQEGHVFYFDVSLLSS